jgi:hypothetical protein
MRAGVDNPAVDEANRVHLHFALGKAYEDAGDYAASFEHYAKGNALHRTRNRYDAELNTKRTERLKAIFTREFFAARAGCGCPAGNPIFIVGMPRAGSTLLEQIFPAPMVEGTMRKLSLA